jgi:hypothetical protein
VRGARIRVAIDGSEVLDFTDRRPLPAGAVGLYQEDARVRFGPLRVTAA